jgi:hypothetical protein
VQLAVAVNDYAACEFCCKLESIKRQQLGVAVNHHTGYAGEVLQALDRHKARVALNGELPNSAAQRAEPVQGREPCVAGDDDIRRLGIAGSLADFCDHGK